ncbi:hypothetical protein HXX76_010924 [Chlamydomonas incerta]|uniref:Uncharacterized protein n=1 Tax=Chlamydomonas incerta TaxID=51695 RepID=A0A835SHA7_CHLIN|nr:hypothetical protein HXX76_010924 [Chlamydomonas incerta]|eukprot:KAG2427207.1 hypothetical protein HXX76_010924 [Chlamydomonas incerta]
MAANNVAANAAAVAPGAPGADNAAGIAAVNNGPVFVSRAGRRISLRFPFSKPEAAFFTVDASDLEQRMAHHLAGNADALARHARVFATLRNMVYQMSDLYPDMLMRDGLVAMEGKYNFAEGQRAALNVVVVDKSNDLILTKNKLTALDRQLQLSQERLNAVTKYSRDLETCWATRQHQIAVVDTVTTRMAVALGAFASLLSHMSGVDIACILSDPSVVDNMVRVAACYMYRLNPAHAVVGSLRLLLKNTTISSAPRDYLCARMPLYGSTLTDEGMMQAYNFVNMINHCVREGENVVKHLTLTAAAVSPQVTAPPGPVAAPAGNQLAAATTVIKQEPAKA